VIDAARERIVLHRSAATFEPSKEAPACIRHDFKLHWSTDPLLDHHRPRSHLTAGDKVANLYLHQIAASQLAVDRKVEERSISQPMLSV